MANYVKSDLIEVFPAGFRDNANAKSKLTTEENLTGLNLLSSDSNIRNRWFKIGEGENAHTIILIEGYKFVIKTENIPNDANYACIKLGELGGSDNTAKTKVLVPWGGSAGEILDSTEEFKGLYFTNEEPTAADNVFYVQKDKNFAVTSSEVINYKEEIINSNKILTEQPINDYFHTKNLNVSTAANILNAKIETANIDNINGINIKDLNTTDQSGLLIENIRDKMSEKPTRISLDEGKIITIDANNTATLGDITLTPDKNNISMGNNHTFNIPKNCTEEGNADKDFALVQKNNSDESKWLVIDEGIKQDGSTSWIANSIVKRGADGRIIVGDIYSGDVAAGDVTASTIKCDRINDAEVKKEIEKTTQAGEELAVLKFKAKGRIYERLYGLRIEDPAILGVNKDGDISTDIDNAVNTNTVFIGAGTYVNPVFEDEKHIKPKGTRIGHVSENTEEGKNNILTLPFDYSAKAEVSADAEAVLAQTVKQANGKKYSEPDWIPTTTSAKDATDANKIVKTGTNGKIGGVAYPHELTIEVGSEDLTVTNAENVSIGEGKHTTAILQLNLKKQEALKSKTEPITAGNDNKKESTTLNIPELGVNSKGIITNIKNNSVDYANTFNKVQVTHTTLEAIRTSEPIPTFYIPLCANKNDDNNKTLSTVDNIKIIDGASQIVLSNVGIKLENLSLTNNNAIVTDGNITCQKLYLTSDKRLKENLKDFKPEKSILDLPIYKYDFIKGDKNQIGCLAQDLKEICPEIVKEDKEGYLSIQESKLVYLLLDEVKKLKAEIENFKK